MSKHSLKFSWITTRIRRLRLALAKAIWPKDSPEKIFFTNARGSFADNTHYLEWDGEALWIVRKNGSRCRTFFSYTLEWALRHVASGAWVRHDKFPF